MFFRPEARRNEKIFTIFLLASMIAFLYGFLTNISPADPVKNNIKYISPILALIYFVPLLLDHHPANKISSFPVFKKIIYYSIALFFAYILAFVIVAYSLPSIFTTLVGQPYKFSAIIEKKNKSTKGCRHEVKLEGVGYGIHNHVCVNSSLWERANAGDEVQVYSLRSALGIKVTAVKYER